MSLPSPVTSSADKPGIRLKPTAEECHATQTWRPGGARTEAGHYVLHGTRLGISHPPLVSAGLVSTLGRAESDSESTPPKAAPRHQTSTRLDGDSDTGPLAQELEVRPSSKGITSPRPDTQPPQPSGPGGDGGNYSTRLLRPRGLGPRLVTHHIGPGPNDQTGPT